MKRLMFAAIIILSFNSALASERAATYFTEANKDTIYAKCNSSWKAPDAGSKTIGQLSLDLEASINNNESKNNRTYRAMLLRQAAAQCIYSLMTKERLDYPLNSPFGRMSWGDQIDRAYNKASDHWMDIKDSCIPAGKKYAEMISAECALATEHYNQVAQIYDAHFIDILDGPKWEKLEQHRQQREYTIQRHVEDLQKNVAQEEAGTYVEPSAPVFQ